jgi:hypothetical protein
MLMRLVQLTAILLAVAILPIAIIIALVAATYNYILKTLVRNELKDENATFVSAVDYAFLQDTGENQAIINSLLTMSGPLDIVKYRHIIMDRLVMAKDPKNPNKTLFPKMSSYTSKVMSR